MNLDSKDISEDFPNSKIYLNNASVSLMPKQSIEAMKEFLITYNSIGPDSIESESFITEKLRNVRNIISKIINCQPDEIVLTRGQFSFREISIEKYDEDGKLLSDEVEDSDISTENKFLLSFLKDQIANTIDRIFSRDEMLLLRLYISDVFQKQDLFHFEEEGGLNKLSINGIHSVEDFTKFYDKAFKKLLKEFRKDLKDLLVKENIKTNNLKDIHFTDGLLLTFFDEFFLDFYSS